MSLENEKLAKKLILSSEYGKIDAASMRVVSEVMKTPISVLEQNKAPDEELISARTAYHNDDKNVIHLLNYNIQFMKIYGQQPYSYKRLIDIMEQSLNEIISLKKTLEATEKAATELMTEKDLTISKQQKEIDVLLHTIDLLENGNV